jgi:hypothetical protein
MWFVLNRYGKFVCTLVLKSAFRSGSRSRTPGKLASLHIRNAYRSTPERLINTMCGGVGSF